MALVVAQSAAGLHVLNHLGARGDTAGVPGQHAQLCLECASFAPLASAHGGTCTPIFVAFVTAGGILPQFDAALPANGRSIPFRARAPPR